MTAKERKVELDLHPDAWQRFERAVDIVAKSPPQHRTKTPKPVARKKAKRHSSKSSRG
jgi:hypothetical protein